MSNTSLPLALDIVVPVLQRAGDARHQHPPPPRLPHRADRRRLAHHDRRQREHRRDARDRRPARRPTCPASIAVHLAEKGRGRALKHVWGSSPAEVLVYLDEDLSTDLAALPPLVAPLLSGHSDLAIGTRLGRSARVDPRRQTRVHLAQLQPAAAPHDGGRVHGCAVRLQGDPPRRRRPAPAARRRQRVVLRHRAADPRRAGRDAHPRDPGRLGRRPGQLGRHRVDGASRTSAGCCGSAPNIARGRIPLEAIYAEFGRRPFEPPRPPGFFGQVVRFGAVGIALHRRVRAPLPRAAGRDGGAGGELRRAAAHDRSRTPGRTGASPSACGGGPGRSGTSSRD